MICSPQGQLRIPAHRDVFHEEQRERNKKKEALEHITDHAWTFLRKASVRKRRMKSRRRAEERLDLARWRWCRLVLRLVRPSLKTSSVEEVHWRRNKCLSNIYKKGKRNPTGQIPAPDEDHVIWSKALEQLLNCLHLSDYNQNNRLCVKHFHWCSAQNKRNSFFLISYTLVKWKICSLPAVSLKQE